jgi:hypothetical protein
MARTLLAFMPPLACPLGMALMAGVPALVHRTRRRRRQAADVAAITGNTIREPIRRVA